MFVLFVCHIEISPTIAPLVTLLLPLQSPTRRRVGVHPSWFHNVSTYSGEVIQYWFFLIKIYLDQN
jgi:hypothetical protein